MKTTLCNVRLERCCAQIALLGTFCCSQGLVQEPALRISKAKELKDEGNELFKRGEWAKAIRKYHHGLMYVRGDLGKNEDLLSMLGVSQTSMAPTEERRQESRKLMISLSNNLAGSSYNA